MNLFGPHIHKSSMGLDLLEKWKSAAALAMDVDSAYVREARRRSPGTVLAVRIYEHGANFTDWSPEDWVDRLLAQFPDDRPDYFVTINEPFGHDHRHLFEPFDAWESEVVRLLQARGTDGLACNFPTGNFTGAGDRVKIPDVFPRICRVANAMGPHDYSWPTLGTGWNWYAGRWFRWYDDIKQATGREMKFLVGECGLTQAVIAERPDHGWQSGGPEGVTAESYLATLRWYLEQVVNWDAGRGIVLGLCLFNWYDQFHASFEHIDRPEVVDAIVAMDVPPPKPNGGDIMVKVIDRNYKEQSEEWAKAEYGIAWDRAAVEPGQKVYRLIELWEVTGPVSHITQVLDESRNPLEGVDVAWYWPGAPDPPDPPTEVYAHDWHRNFVHGLTNVNGDVGPGMGGGAARGKGECGPHEVWVRDPEIKSDALKCIGWRAMTPHDHLNCKFMLMTEGEPPPDEGTLEKILKVEAESRDLLKEIRDILKKEPPPPPPDTPYRGEYFANRTLSGSPAFVRDDEEIDFNWGAGSPDPRLPADNFSVRWTGKRAFEAGTYRFHTLTDDGVRLWVDGALLIDKWVDQAPKQWVSVPVDLAAGQHDIRMEYYEHGGGAVARMWYVKV